LTQETVWAERQGYLRDLGFGAYLDYLESDLWRSIRERVFAESRECFACGRYATQVHHERYTPENLSGRSLAGLWRVCGSCHHLAEFSKDGSKRTLQEANAWLILKKLAREARCSRGAIKRAKRLLRAAKRSARAGKRKRSEPVFLGGMGSRYRS
jgi:hypothetical protein